MSKVAKMTDDELAGIEKRLKDFHPAPWVFAILYPQEIVNDIEQLLTEVKRLRGYAVTLNSALDEAYELVEALQNER